MARTTDEILAEMLAEIRANDVIAGAIPADGVLSTSKRSITGAFAFCIAAGIATHEQLIDVFKAGFEDLAAKSAAASPLWIQDRMLKMQYSEVAPQVVQLIDTAPAYPVVDPSLRIISRCNVKTTLSGSVEVKLAKNEPPEGLSDNERAAAQSYINTIGAGGIDYIVKSSNADRAYIAADIYFNGAYSAVILENVRAAISAYFTYLSVSQFNGSVLMSSIELAIRNVPGVSDVILRQVRARKDGADFSAGTDLILNAQVIGRLWQTIAGYIVLEDTPGYTLAESLNFIAQ